jgi:large subunit ribosomal protein L21
MFAVIKTGGKQFLVREGDVLKVEKLELEVGAGYEPEVLMVAEDDGSTVKVGQPLVKGAKVAAIVTEHGKAKKISVIKYKPKVRYRRNVGHRQPFTKIKIEKITA